MSARFDSQGISSGDEAGLLEEVAKGDGDYRLVADLASRPLRHRLTLNSPTLLTTTQRTCQTKKSPSEHKLTSRSAGYNVSTINTIVYILHILYYVYKYYTIVIMIMIRF